MANQLVAFDSTSALPAFLRADTTGNLAAFTSGGGFNTLSIKGKVFHTVVNGEKTLITQPDGDGAPAPSVEVVILDIGPRGKLSARIFYATKYVEGSVESPDCSSNDGVAPDAGVKDPQSSKCATCQHNVKGSGATATNPTGKACGSSKRLAIATLDNLGEPMLLRVPGDSIVALGDHLTVLKNRGVPNSYGVVTKIGFDYSVSHPKLTFKPVSFVNAAQYAEAGEVAKTDLSHQIIGLVEAPLFEGEPAPALAAPKPAAPAPKTEIKVAAEVDETNEIPDAPAPKPVAKPAAKAVVAKPAPKPAPAPVEEVSTVDAGLSASLDDLDFDD